LSKVKIPKFEQHTISAEEELTNSLVNLNNKGYRPTYLTSDMKHAFNNELQTAGRG
jgi:hypothetical protein